MGARVIAAVGSREKEGPARRLGADDVVFYEAERPLREQLAELEPGGIDVIVDPVGGAVFEQAARALAPFGRALVVGFAAGAIPKLATNLVLLKESSVIGVYWGAFREREPRRAAEHLAEIWQLMSDGAVQPPPITQAPLEDAARVLGKLADRKMIGRAVLLPNSPNMDDSR
jgi:NADPH2:quinone reductase